MEGQGEHPEGWEARDARSGVARIFEEAKERNMLGLQVVGAWGVALLMQALLGFAGVIELTPPLWDTGAGLGGVVLAALAMSRTPAPLLASAVLVVLDQAALAFQFALLIDQGTVAEHLVAAARMLIAPVVIYFAVGGWSAAIAIQAFKNGFSPGVDWRTRINPRTLSIGIVISCFVGILLGVGLWLGAIRSGFWQEAPKEEKAKEGLAEVVRRELAKRPEALAPPTTLPEKIEYPDTARPVATLDGLDDYARTEAEDAWYFAQDTDENGCVQEGHGRQGRCRDDRCQYWARFFVRACLVKSAKTPKFCVGVPKPTEGAAGVEWAHNLCAGRPEEPCRELLFAVQGHCHPPEATDQKAPDQVAPPRRPAR